MKLVFFKRKQIIIVFSVLIAAALAFMFYLLNVLNTDEAATLDYQVRFTHFESRLSA